MRAFVATILALCVLGAQAQSPDLTTKLDSVVESLTSGILSKIQTEKTAASNLIPGLSTLKTLLGTQLANAETNLEGLASTIEAKFCTPAKFSAGATVPATFTGPSFDLTFATGDCAFDTKIFKATGKQVLKCTEPSITFTKTPASFVSSYTTGASFTSAHCNVTQVFGEESEKTLYTFDGSKQLPSVEELTTTVTDEVKGLLSDLSTKVSEPIQAIESLKSGLKSTFLSPALAAASAELSPALAGLSAASVASSPNIYSQAGAILTQLAASLSPSPAATTATPSTSGH